MMKRILSRIVPAMSALLFVSVCTTVPGDTAESPQLRQDVTSMVIIMDGPRDKGCTERKIVKTEVVEARPDGTPAVERWALDRCGRLVNYRVRYIANSKGGADFDVQIEK
jgi:hypothetical protein